MIRTCLFTAKDPLGCMEWLVQREYLAIMYMTYYHIQKNVYFILYKISIQKNSQSFLFPEAQKTSTPGGAALGNVRRLEIGSGDP